jgi:elongation factor Ts
VTVALGEDAMAMVEINCETDFVAKGEDFQALARMAAEAVLRERPADVTALGQVVVDGETLDQRRRALVAKLGENMTLRRFAVVEAAGGALAHYLHGTRIGVVVAMKQGDAELARDLAMHIAASRPQFLSAEQVPAEVRDNERRILIAQAQDSGKPADIIEKMVDGRVRKFLAEITLLGQPFVKDPDHTVEKLLKARGAEVASFVRFELGEGIEKEAADFAAEVRATAKASQS